MRGASTTSPVQVDAAVVTRATAALVRPRTVSAPSSSETVARTLRVAAPVAATTVLLSPARLEDRIRTSAVRRRASAHRPIRTPASAATATRLAWRPQTASDASTAGGTATEPSVTPTVATASAAAMVKSVSVRRVLACRPRVPTITNAPAVRPAWGSSTRSAQKAQFSTLLALAVRQTAPARISPTRDRAPDPSTIASPTASAATAPERCATTPITSPAATA